MRKNIQMITASDEMWEPRGKKSPVIKSRINLAHKGNMRQPRIAPLPKARKLPKEHAMMAIHKPTDEYDEVFISRGLRGLGGLRGCELDDGARFCV